jgi:hypothetical protein
MLSRPASNAEARENGPAAIVKSATQSWPRVHASRLFGQQAAAGSRGGTFADGMPGLKGIPADRFVARHRIRLAVSSSEALSRVGGDMGRWLRARHDATRAPAAPLQAERLLRQIHDRLDAATGRGVSADAASWIREQAAYAVARLARARIPHAARQGLLCADDTTADGPTVRIAGLEQLGETDAVYQDIASFSATLRLRAALAVYSRAKAAGMRRAFLWAYGQSDTDPVLALYELRHVLAALAESAARPSIFGWRSRRALAREARELAGRLATVRHHPAVDLFETPTRREAEPPHATPNSHPSRASYPPMRGG